MVKYFWPDYEDLGKSSREQSQSTTIAIDKRQMKAEYTYPLTKSASSSAPSNYESEPVADPAMMAIRVDNLSWAAERAGSDKPKHGPPVLNQRSLKIAEGLLQ